jgi:hypothetical protein
VRPDSCLLNGFDDAIASLVVEGSDDREVQAHLAWRLWAGASLHLISKVTNATTLSDKPKWRRWHVASGVLSEIS